MMDTGADLPLSQCGQSQSAGNTGLFIDILVSQRQESLLAQGTRSLAFSVMACNHGPIREQFPEEYLSFVFRQAGTTRRSRIRQRGLSHIETGERLLESGSQEQHAHIE